jgi:hypothetical protein
MTTGSSRQAITFAAPLQSRQVSISIFLKPLCRHYFASIAAKIDGAAHRYIPLRDLFVALVQLLQDILFLSSFRRFCQRQLFLNQDPLERGGFTNAPTHVRSPRSGGWDPGWYRLEG